MKKKYSSPSIIAGVRKNGVVPAAALVSGAALLAGYALGKAVTSAIDNKSLKKLQTLQTIGDTI
ncbi:MAG: hypothetical protein KHX78_02235 [Megasphaera micronuciformis]|jgi:hypothetical protein|nr:hypothetical protein [Megasphaera micronuciformis]